MEPNKIFLKVRAEAALNLWHWLNGGTNFTSLLYSLIQKADPCNRSKLRFTFPIESEIFDEWQSTRSEAEFFRKYGVIADTKQQEGEAWDGEGASVNGEGQ